MKKIIFLLLIFSISLSLSCKKNDINQNNYLVTKKEASIVANTIISSLSKSSKEIEQIDLVEDSNNETACYVVNYTHSGFVLVSGDKRFSPILGYSETNEFKLDNLPPQLAELMDKLKLNIEYARDNNSEPTDNIVREWNIYLRPVYDPNSGGSGTLGEPGEISDDPVDNTPILIDIEHIQPLLTKNGVKDVDIMIILHC